MPERAPRVVLGHRDLDQPVAGRVVAGEDLRALEAGDVERLGRRDHRDRVVGGALEGQVRHVLGARQHQRAVDLVGHDPGAVPGHDVADPLELGAGVHVAARVVRLGEQQRPRTAREQPVERVEVDDVACRRPGPPAGPTARVR